MRKAGAALVLAVALVAAGLGLARATRSRIPVAPPIVVSSAFQDISDTLRSGETLDDVFSRHGLLSSGLTGIFERAGLDPRRLRAGLVVVFRSDLGQTLPARITMRTSPVERLAAYRRAEGWVAERHPVAWKSVVVRIEGPIESSLYEALDATIPDTLLDSGSRIRLAWDLADVYAWAIDFNRDIQPGDRFAVLINRDVSEEGEVRSGDVLAADLLASGKHLNAYRFEPVEHVVRFFDEAGRSLRRAFLRAPVEFRRISSSFSRSRFHPILGIWRRHEGTDYAAQSGTPVLAAGDGTVLRAGRAGGYGNLVEIRHMSGITTRYGHLRAFARGVHPGKRVSQGDVIGYVGATGLASAPHLHYEFRVNGAAKDSRRVALGSGEPIARDLLPRFMLERDKLARALGTSGPAVAPATAPE